MNRLVMLGSSLAYESRMVPQSGTTIPKPQLKQQHVNNTKITTQSYQSHSTLTIPKPQHVDNTKPQHNNTKTAHNNYTKTAHVNNTKTAHVNNTKATTQ